MDTLYEWRGSTARLTQQGSLGEKTEVCLSIKSSLIIVNLVPLAAHDGPEESS